ncbi:MAG: HlyC/CorC family transporter [Lachnospiraceae bacterium]|nr:HlyC/CorC family transporter [Lachnospiraceae bacterium]
MEDGNPTVGIIAFILLIFIDMFFYGFGSAVHCLNIKNLEKTSEEEEHRGKKKRRLKALIEEPGGYINTLQLVVTLIHLGMGSFYLKIWQDSFRELLEGRIEEKVTGILSLLSGTAGLVYILLTFGVLLPKRIAARYPEKWAYLCINPVYYIVKLLSPLTGLVTVTVNGLLRLMGIRENHNGGDVTEEEIISMVNEGHEQGVLQATEAEMITNIFAFGDKEAQDIMTHRNSMVAVEGSLSLQEAVAFMLEANNSRFPVYEENIDHIIGIVHLRDAMRIHASGKKADKPLKEIKELLREPVFIPETKNIDALFQMMQSSKTQMVVVVDEYGQTVGLLAMEDILEEIVGNILDEYDEDEEHIEATANEDEYIIEGKTPLKELEERFGLVFDKEEFETLNGFLIAKLDRIPEEDEDFEVDVGEYRFRILSVENKMIQSVLVHRI